MADSSRYIVYVLFLSLSLEFPRFFEFQLVERSGRVHYWTTALMEDPEYIRFSSYWDDLVTKGFVPLLALSYFNSRYLQNVWLESNSSHL